MHLLTAQLTPWLAAVDGGGVWTWVFSFFGAMVAAGVIGLVVLVAALRMARRRWDNLGRDWRLLRHPEGRRVLGLSREIRGGTRRVLALLARNPGDRNEARALRNLLNAFATRDLPETMDRAMAFVTASGGHPLGQLRETLAQQQRRWSEAPDDAGREKLNQEIAATRRALAQAEEAGGHMARLLGSLDDAASSLRQLEYELASLQAERSPALEQFREQLAETAENLRFERDAYRSLNREP